MAAAAGYHRFQRQPDRPLYLRLEDFEPFIQGALVYEGERSTDLRRFRMKYSASCLRMPFDLSAGVRKNNRTLNLYVKTCSTKAPSSTASRCAPSRCAARPVTTPSTRMDRYTR